MRAITKPECLESTSIFYKSFPRRIILKKMAIWFGSYMETFYRTLLDHFENEYEVQIRNGKITDSGEKILKKLGSEFDILQFERNISNMLRSIKTTYKSFIKSRPHINDLLDVVYDDLVREVHLFVFKTQQQVLKNRRSKTNKLCHDKTAAGPSVFNFTEHKIAPELMKHLKAGLKNVPVVKVDESDIAKELKEEAVSACRAMFRSEYGYYPAVTTKCFDNALVQIISKCSANSKLVGQICDFRQDFVENMPFFLSSLVDSGLNVKHIISLIPNRSIVTNSDKNVGVSILPTEWYEKEYQSQILKGGHELVNLSEDECLSQLASKISVFKAECTSNQRKLLDPLWPRCTVKYRLGVMKLVPKVILKSHLATV